MNPVTLLLVYVVIWWLVFFMTLSVGVQAQNETEEGAVAGTPESAPSNPNLKKKALWATLIAAVLTGIYWAIVVFDLITLRPEGL